MVFLLVLFLLSGSVVMAQEDTLAVSSQKRLDDKKWALLFQISSNFTLRSFQGSVISIKKNLSPQKAIRIGISFDADFGDVKRSSLEQYEPHENQDELDDETSAARGDVDQIEFDVAAQYLHYSVPQKNVSAFVGIGGIWELRRMESVYRSESQDNSSSGGTIEAETIENRVQSHWGLSLTGVLGVEWFCLESISLIGEYALMAGYRSMSDIRHVVREHQGVVRAPTLFVDDVVKEKHWFVRGNAVKLGLSVYF